MEIIYTLTDEAPALATASLLPILERVRRRRRHRAGAARHLARGAGARAVPGASRRRPARRRRARELGELRRSPEANIIKLPNISASLPQLKVAIAELQRKGYAIPDYPDEPSNAAERDVRARYERGQGQRRQPGPARGQLGPPRAASVKEYARTHPHSMGAWPPSSRSHVSTMSDGDFRSTEASVTVAGARTLTIEHLTDDGARTVLRGGAARHRRRRARRGGDAARGARGVLRDAGRRDPRGRPALLGPPEGDDDEGLRPDHLRSRRPRLLRRAVRDARRRASRPSASTPTTASRPC